MNTTTDERERPHEWLRHLSEDRHAFGALVASDDLLGCAYRIAVARRRVADRGAAQPLPTLREVDAALCQLELRGVSGYRTPRAQLREACESRGLPVIAPVVPRAA
ncbi:MAG: hypothetical protein U0414_25100 [Polyangiaceae bacterium]